MEPATEVALGTLNYFHQLGLDAFEEARSLVHPGSDLAADVAALNGVTEIDLGKQAWYPLLTACEVAGNVPVLFGPNGTDVRPMPLAVLMRTVLIGAAKSIYVLAPDDSSERQLRLLRVANVDLTDEVRSLTAAASLNAMDPGADYSKPLASNTTAQQQVATELVGRGQEEKMRVREGVVLDAAADVVLAHFPEQPYMPDLTKLLWNDTSGASHARAWHRGAFYDTYTASYRTLQLLIPAHAFLDTAWRLWHQRRGGTGDPYNG